MANLNARLTAMHAEAHCLGNADLDNYANRGVALSRDSASVVIAALKRDAYEMRERGGEANVQGAETNDRLADLIGQSLVL